jgi:hypothetical protein
MLFHVISCLIAVSIAGVLALALVAGTLGSFAEVLFLVLYVCAVYIIVKKRGSAQANGHPLTRLHATGEDLKPRGMKPRQ